MSSDTSENSMLPSWPYIAGGLVGLVIVALLISAAIWPTINEVETGETPEYPDIQPQFYSSAPKKVFREIRAGIKQLDRWQLEEVSEDELQLEATRRTLIFRFVDDVTVWVTEETEDITRVDVRSESRVGEGDFGQNARNIEELFAELDDRLGGEKIARSELNDGADE